MLPKGIEQRLVRHSGNRVCQGDIFTDLEPAEWRIDSDTYRLIVNRLKFPYSVIVSQDCDLEQDCTNRASETNRTHDKFIQTLLLCPAYLAQKLREGKHLEEIGLTMEYHNSKTYPKIKEQNNPRYHYIEGCQDLQVPDLIVDFKHYYTLSRDTIYSLHKTHYQATLNFLFREELSQRFAAYLSRIGVPPISLRAREDTSSSTSDIEDEKAGQLSSANQGT